MIDTLARHLAALSEARRLLTLVLANNPDFRANPHPAAPGLADDPYFKALCHIRSAIDLLEPAVAADQPRIDVSSGPISQRITLLSAHQKHPKIDAVLPLSEAPSVPDRAKTGSGPPAPTVGPVCSPVARIVNDQLVYAPPSWIEATVAIVNEPDATVGISRAKSPQAASATATQAPLNNPQSTPPRRLGWLRSVLAS